MRALCLQALRFQLLFTMQHSLYTGTPRPGWALPGGRSSFQRSLGFKRSPINTSKLLLNAASHAKSAVAAAGPTSSSNQPDSAATLVWGLQPTVRPEVHVVMGPQLAVTQIVPLQIKELHPDLLTKNNFMEFLAKNLMSKGAKRQGVEALVLTAAYLPSQLDTMRDLAAKQSVGLSVYLSSSKGTMHSVFQRLQPAPAPTEDQQQDQQQQVCPQDIRNALVSSLGPLEPLSNARLQVAQMAEQSLRQQLRLWDPATWSTVLQQQLESGSACYSFLAVRSLMGPPALQAAQRLVEKKGLNWLEVQEDQLQAPAANQEDSNSSTSRSRSRRRGSTAAQSGAGSLDSEAAADREQQQQGGGGIVIVISRVGGLSADALRQLPEAAFQKCFTDFRVTRSSNNSGGTNSGGDPETAGGSAQAVGLPRLWVPQHIWPLSRGTGHGSELTFECGSHADDLFER